MLKTSLHCMHVCTNNSVSLEIFHLDQIKLVVSNGSMLARFDVPNRACTLGIQYWLEPLRNAPIRYAQICTQQVYQEVPHACMQRRHIYIHKHRNDKHATYMMICMHTCVMMGRRRERGREGTERERERERGGREGGRDGERGGEREGREGGRERGRKERWSHNYTCVYMVTACVCILCVCTSDSPSTKTLKEKQLQTANTWLIWIPIILEDNYISGIRFHTQERPTETTRFIDFKKRGKFASSRSKTHTLTLINLNLIIS